MSAVMNKEQRIERAMQAKGAIGPRITPADIDAVIMRESYTVLPSGRMMVCELTLRNGYTVAGMATTVTKGHFDEEIGREIAYENARPEFGNWKGICCAMLWRRVSKKLFRQ